MSILSCSLHTSSHACQISGVGTACVHARVCLTLLQSANVVACKRSYRLQLCMPGSMYLTAWPLLVCQWGDTHFPQSALPHAPCPPQAPLVLVGVGNVFAVVWQSVCKCQRYVFFTVSQSAGYKLTHCCQLNKK